MSELSTERNVLFISHALPEDVEVALWVAAKLRNEGYTVWCEVEQVHGGEHFWKEIEPIIRDKTAKFILLASNASVKKPGVRDEWDFARTVAREQGLTDFIIPINLDGVSPSAIIGMTGLAMIQFQVSWAHGLRALLKKLYKDEVPKSTESTPLSAAHWYFSRNAATSSTLKKTEVFYSNWLALPSLPKSLYFHRYSNDTLAKAALDNIRKAELFPVVRHDNYLIAFEPTMPLMQLGQSANDLFEPINVKPIHRLVVDTHKVCEHRYHSDTFPQKQDASNLLVQFLQHAIHEFLLSRGLKTHEMSNKRLCYYYPRIGDADRKAKYSYEGKIRTKQVSGVYYDSFWHFGVSFNPRLRPELSLSFKSHIVFSDDGQNIWTDDKKLFSARRRKGKLMYNAQWRDSLLSFLGSLSDNQTDFAVPVAADKQLLLSATPITFNSSIGYEDPVDQGRLAPLDDYDEEKDYSDDTEFDAEATLAELIAIDLPIQADDEAK
jgi:hypothetical protein